MASRNGPGPLSALLRGVVGLFTRGAPPTRPAPPRRSVPAPRPTGRPAASDPQDTPGRGGATATREVAPPARGGLRITYTPQRDGAPDAGEVVWTWVPYEENDGRGKDRPVLVIGTDGADRVYAVRLTSKSHDGDRDYLSIGPGPWDAQGRPSWVDIEQLYSVHVRGMRREAATLDRRRFAVVAAALQQRYGWASEL